MRFLGWVAKTQPALQQFKAQESLRKSDDILHEMRLDQGSNAELVDVEAMVGGWYSITNPYATKYKKYPMKKLF